MFRLFKCDENGNIAAYHEVWVELKPRRIIEHWGMLGTRGDTDAHRIKLFRSLEQQISDLLDPARALGFSEIDQIEYKTLIVAYEIGEAWCVEDQEKIRAAEDALTETLGWTGLGTCEGETVSETMIEYTCRVVDIDLATACIRDQMADTEFDDYSRIHQE